MKKFFSIALCVVILCVSLCSCSGSAEMNEENIKSTVAEAQAALKSFDIDELEKYIDSSTLSFIIGYAKDKNQFAELGKAIFENLDMQIESIDVENATVTVSVTNKDLAATASNFAAELTSQYSSVQLLTKLKDDSFLDLYLKALCEDIDGCQMKPYPEQITLSVGKSGKNLVLQFDEAGENAVSGGALTAIKTAIL